MKIFPLSVPGKIVLILIAIILGIICWAMWYPDKFRAFMAWLKGNKGDKEETK